MSYNHNLPKKISLVPKKHHGFQVVIFILGCLLPPLGKCRAPSMSIFVFANRSISPGGKNSLHGEEKGADGSQFHFEWLSSSLETKFGMSSADFSITAVALRFGLGTDFLINTFLCICGYFPCHFHNFYIQNIRNNSNKARTPKWAIKAGLIDPRDSDRKKAKSQWSKRFDERNAHSTHMGQALEEGEEGADYAPVSDADREAAERRRNEGLWTGEDETYYNEDPNRAPNQNHWHYPANFEGAVGDGRSKRNGAAKMNGSADRWERSRASRTNSNSSESTYPPAGATDDDVPEWGRDYGSKRRSTKNKKQSGAGAAVAPAGKGGWANGAGYVDDIEQNDGWGGAANGGARANGNARTNGNAVQKQGRQSSGGDIFEHEF